MNEEKLLGLQMQVRQNQQEFMDYVKELDGWGEEMKLKEQQLTQETKSISEVSLIYSRLADALIHCILCVWRHRNVCSSSATY